MNIPTHDLIVLKEKTQGYQPTQDEIEQYAQYLGLKLPQDSKYLSLVREALMAPLPSGWQACAFPDDENVKTQQTTYEHPLDTLYRKKIAQLQRFQDKYLIEPIAEESALGESSSVVHNKIEGSQVAHQGLIQDNITQISESVDSINSSQKSYSQKNKSHNYQYSQKSAEFIQAQQPRLQQFIKQFAPKRHNLMQIQGSELVAPQNKALYNVIRFTELKKLENQLKQKKEELQLLKRKREANKSLLSSLQNSTREIV